MDSREYLSKLRVNGSGADKNLFVSISEQWTKLTSKPKVHKLVGEIEEKKTVCVYFTGMVNLT